MGDLEKLVIDQLEKLLADTTWKSSRGGMVPMSLYQGRLPKRGAATAAGISEEVNDYEDPFILVRDTGFSGTLLKKTSSLLLWAQLWDGPVAGGDYYDVYSGRKEVDRLSLILEKILKGEFEDFAPWNLVGNVEIQKGDEFGNQSDPEFVMLVKLSFYRGS